MMHRKLVVIGILLGLSFGVHADEAGVGKTDSSNKMSSSLTIMDGPTEDQAWYELMLAWFDAEEEETD